MALRSPTVSADNPLERPTALHLELGRDGDRIRVCAYESRPDGMHTVRHYEEMTVAPAPLARQCQALVRMLNSANQRGMMPPEVLSRLKSVGQSFSDTLFPLSVKEQLRSSKAHTLSLHLDDPLVHIPWELLHDGERFLCQRFALGRLVRTRQHYPAGKRMRTLSGPLKMLILADPAGDLKGAYAEGLELRELMDRFGDPVSAAFCADHISPDRVREKLRHFDMAHFAGHCDYSAQAPAKSGWRLTHGHFRAEDIMKMAGTGTLPAFIFSNACQSARTGQWEIRERFQQEIFGLANAFLLAGVRHYLGTFWEIPDAPSRCFALAFYQRLLAGACIGEALRSARHALIAEYGEGSVVWASYLLYGDPGFRYRIPRTEPRPPKARPPHPEPVTEVRGRPPRSDPGEAPTTEPVEDRIDFGRPRQKPVFRRLSLWASVLAVLVLAWAYPGFWSRQTEQRIQAAVIAYEDGELARAKALCQKLIEKAPDHPLAYRIAADIALRNGRIQAARSGYQKALKRADQMAGEKAKALMGLARIAASEGSHEQAQALYTQAAELNPALADIWLARALLKEQSGENTAALALLKKGARADDPLVQALAREIRDRIRFSQNQEKQARIDRLIEELSRQTTGQVPAMPLESQTANQPLTLWITAIESRGHGAEMGQARLLEAGIRQALTEAAAIQVVERALMEGLLSELRLGSSDLADPKNRLALGRLTAARLMLTGRIFYTLSQTQVALRVIETETGQIALALSQRFEPHTPAGEMVKKIAEPLLQKLKTRYNRSETIDSQS